LKTLADQYTTSDNHHQGQMGGTTVNHFYLAMADNVYFSDGQFSACSISARRSSKRHSYHLQLQAGEA
jgi:phospholipase C